MIQDDILDQRAKHKEQWGGMWYDDTHNEKEWLWYMTVQLEKAVTAIENGDSNEYRNRIIRVMSLGYDALESFDRKKAII